jgi:hypothetical protein
MNQHPSDAHTDTHKGDKKSRQRGHTRVVTDGDAMAEDRIEDNDVLIHAGVMLPARLQLQLQ